MNNMTYRGYAAHMDFDTDDKIIVGRVIDIDDIITFHGTSVAEFEWLSRQQWTATSTPASNSGNPLTNPPAAG